MKPQPFNLELWLHLGKPDCVWTKNNKKVFGLTFYHYAKNNYPDNSSAPVLSGIMDGFLCIWDREGREEKEDWELYSGNDLMLYLEDKPKTFGIKKK